MKRKPGINNPHLLQKLRTATALTQHGTREGTIDMSAAVVVRLSETLDVTQVRRLGRELKTKISAECPRIILDLSRVKDINISGLEALLSCMDEVVKQDGGLQLTGVSAEAATLLELTRMDRLMQKFPGFTVEAPQFEIAAEMVVEEVPDQNPVQLPVTA